VACDGQAASTFTCTSNAVGFVLTPDVSPGTAVAHGTSIPFNKGGYCRASFRW